MCKECVQSKIIKIERFLLLLHDSIKNPLLTVITSIDYDHTEYLGNTLKKIAYEKAGIMKTGCTCIIADQHY